jgi:hypothetical protein
MVEIIKFKLKIANESIRRDHEDYSDYDFHKV